MVGVRNIVKSSVVLIILLLGMIGYVSAQQNTATNPYQDSKHTYRVKIGLAANDREWTITDGTLNYDLLDAQPFAVTYVAGADGGYDVISITFDAEDFSAGNWALRFREIDNSNSCISAREFPITISANTFYYALAADNNLCNAETNDLHTYAQVRTDVPANVYPTPVTYTVTMNKDALFETDTFRFDLNFSQPITDDGVTVTTAAGVATVVKLSAASNTDYRISVVPSNKAITSATMAINVSYSNFVVGNAGGSVVNTMSLTNGLAVVIAPPAPDALTDDNIIGHSDGSPVRQQAITILDIPSTNDIQPGVGETTWSAQNPRANSTHRYTVAMGNVSQIAGAEWYITTSADPATKLAAGYTVTSSNTATDAVAAVNFTTLPSGSYILYFVENTALNASCNCACSTVRQYPFTLREPFDVDITEVDSDCSGADQKIYNQTYTAPITESTSVIYNITLTNADYDATWQFNLQLACSEFDGSELVATDANISVTGGSIGTIARSSGLITIPVVITDDVSTVVNKSVSVTVNYSGVYASEHDITASLVVPSTPGSFGAYNEIDKDNGVALDATESNEGSINITTHTIYAMPQAGILAGVD